VQYTISIDDEFGTFQGEIVAVSDELDDNILDKLQDLYDNLQDEQEQLLETTDNGLLTNAAGMEVDLLNGDKCTLRLSPEVINRILQVLEFEELQAFVQTIATSVQNPDNGPFCKEKK